MTNKMKNVFTTVTGLVIIAVTLVVFFVGFSNTEKTAMLWIALLFILTSEVALILSVIWTNKSAKLASDIIKVGMFSTLFLYFIFTVIIGLLSKSIFAEHTGWFITMHIFVLGIVIIIVMTLYTSATHVQATHKPVKSEDLLSEKSKNHVLLLSNNVNYSTFKPKLISLYEELRFSERLQVNIALDQVIYDAIIDLSHQLNKNEDSLSDESITNSINAIIMQIKERNIAAIQFKRENG